MASKPEDKVAKIMQEFLKILDIDKIPETLVKQVAYRIGIKVTNQSEKALKEALDRINISPTRHFTVGDMIEFDIDDVGSEGGIGVGLKPSFNFDGHTVVFSQINSDLFTVVDDVFLPVLGKAKGNHNIRTKAGFQFMHETVKDFLDGFVSGKFSENVPEVNYFKRVCNGARDKILGTSVQVDTENVLKYQKYLKKQEALKPFQSIGNVSAETRVLFEVPFLADKAINLIMKKGFSHGESVAIYNARFACNYEPVTGTNIVCAKCYKVNSFFADMKGSEKCENAQCNQPLFRNCTKVTCGRSIPAYLEICPHCGSRESDEKDIKILLDVAKKFAMEGHIEKAEEYIAILQATAPQRKSDIASITKIINQEKVARQSMLDEINELISNKKFYSARTQLNSAKRVVPFDMLKGAEIQVVSAIVEAEKLFSLAGESAQQLQRVLAICADHSEAIKYRDKIPPKAPRTMATPFISYQNQVQLSWSSSPDNDVVYILVRKKGEEPVSIRDGEVLIETEKLEATDNSPIPGIVYYAVFSKRGQRYSSEKQSGAVKYAPPVSEFTLRLLKRQKIEFTYTIPSGAIGVKIKKVFKDGKSEVIYEGNKVVSTDPSPPRMCTYSITAIYEKNLESTEEKRFFNADILPTEIHPVFNQNDNVIDITWKTNQTGYSVKVVSMQGDPLQVNAGDFFIEDDIESFESLAQVNCEVSQVTVNLGINKRYNLVVLLGNQDGYLCCAVQSFFAGKFPKLQQIATDVDQYGAHTFSFDHALSDNEILYTISRQHSQPHSSSFKSEKVTKYDKKGNPTLVIPNLNFRYVGLYYIFCCFRQSDGSMSEPVRYKVHFKQEVYVDFWLKQKGTNLNVTLNFEFKRYDFANFSQIPPLVLEAGGYEYSIGNVATSSNNLSMKVTKSIVLQAPITNPSQVRLVVTDPVFRGDFRPTNRS